MTKPIKLDSLSSVAIVGMAGRFPGAKNVDELWQNLRDGVESISFFSDEELNEENIDPSLRSKPNYVKARGVLKGLYRTEDRSTKSLVNRSSLGPSTDPRTVAANAIPCQSFY